MAMAGHERGSLFSSELEYDSKLVLVTLTPKCIVISQPPKHKHGDECHDSKELSNECQEILLNEVISVQAVHTSPSKDKFRRISGNIKYVAVEMQSVRPVAFIVHMIKRSSKYRLKCKDVTFSCKDHHTCEQWINKIKEILFAPGTCRPQNLLVFVNPFGGKRRAPKVYEKVRPLFDMAGITIDLIETQRQFHARDVLQTYQLSSVDGVVCVGGDGTFSEILNGLIDRCNKDENVEQTFRHQPVRPRLRIGIIPAGSTDSIVYTTIGINDPVTSALQIILGDSVGVDVNALYKKEEFVKYSVTMTSYGYYGDLLEDSEKLRWMGPKRYNWSGFKKFLINRSYEGEVSYLPADGNSGNPRDGTKCYSGCMVCQTASKAVKQSSEVTNHSVSSVTFDLGPEESSFEGERWQTISGKFMAINCVTISCRTALSPEGMSPSTHLGDGCMDLILIRDCSRLDYLRHLTRIPRQQADHFDFNFVEVVRVREIKFQPTERSEEEDNFGESSGAERIKQSTSTKSLKHSSSSSSSVWNCDGELVKHPQLHIQVHCQLVQLFARGVEDRCKLEVEKHPNCC